MRNAEYTANRPLESLRQRYEAHKLLAKPWGECAATRSTASSSQLTEAPGKFIISAAVEFKQ
jgi:hypothetical protein